MKIKWKTLFFSIALPIFIGILASLISRESMAMFDMIIKPKLSPPGWLFPVVWTILYILMGISSYLVFTSLSYENINSAIKFYGIQLIFNFFWTIWFFNFQLYWFSFFWLLILWGGILITIFKFYKISKPAAYLMLPYLIWVTFAGYLNFSIAILN